jgi:tol-pal system protein YbgF
MRLTFRSLVPLVALATSACFATRNDVRVLQGDISTLRAERAMGDSARAQQIDRIIATLRIATDSLRSLAGQSARFQGDARESLRELREAITQVQELTGQSQKRLQEIRASVEARPEAAPTDSTGAPGPNQLYQLASQQFQRNSYAAARTAFSDLLTRYPTADVAPDALYYIGESFAAEKNTASADSAYEAVVTRYPSAFRAPTALYKRARLRQAANKTAEARTLYQELRRKYPKSDEADLACSAMPNLCPKR